MTFAIRRPPPPLMALFSIFKTPQEGHKTGPLVKKKHLFLWSKKIFMTGETPPS